MLPRASIGWTYDLVFSLAETAQAKKISKLPHTQRKKSFGISMVPSLVKRAGGGYVAGTNYGKELQRERSDLVNRVGELAAGCRVWMRKAVEEVLDAGYRVVHIPFTPGDNAYARTCLQGSRIDYHSYVHSPLTVLDTLGQCRHFLAARYQSLITVTPVIAFEYASKCTRLLDYLGIGSNRRGYDKILTVKTPDVVAEAERAPVLLDPARLSSISRPLAERMDLVLKGLSER